MGTAGTCAEVMPMPDRFKGGFFKSDVCGRFAPSPSGPLHFGSLVAALGSFLSARSQGGQWRLRIEDLDTPRVLPDAAQAQMTALRNLGLHWDGEALWQSQRLPAYHAALERLRQSGLLFECRCSRRELEGGVHRHCIGERHDGPAALRLRLPDREIRFIDRVRGPQRQNLAQAAGDIVLRRVDGIIAYQLAVVVDDAAQGISEVVRGADLIDSTARQIFLQQLLGLPTPAYAHLPLALDAHGHKLSKSQQAPGLDPAQALPALEAAWAFLGQRRITAHSVPAWIEAAVAAFETQRIPAQDAIAG